MIPDFRFENLEPLLPSLEAVARFCGEWHREITLEPAAVKSLRRMVIASSAGASTRIEGARLSNRQAMAVVLSRKRLYEERSAGEVLGYSEALENIWRHQRIGKAVLSQPFIKQLHSMVMQYSETTLNGRYRFTEVNVIDGRGGILLVCALPDLIPGFMEKAVTRLNRDWGKSERSKPVIIAEFIAEFLAIHPFEDGNGRCARLLTILLLRLSGHDYLEYTSLEEQIEKYKPQYYLSLNAVQKTGVLDAWLQFLLMTLRQSQLALKSRLKKLQPGKSAQPTSLVREIAGLFLEKQVFTAGEIVKLTGKSPAGVRKALSELVRKKTVKAFGENKGRYYRSLARATKF